MQDEAQHPEWVRKTIARPYIQDTGKTVQDFLLRVIPKDLHPPSGGQQG